MADYIYAATRVHYRETQCLNGAFIETLLAARDDEEVLRLLSERGWGDGGKDADGALADQRRRTWDFARELLGGGGELDTLLRQNDYHNLKAAIKHAVRPTDRPIYLEPGTIPVAALEKTVADGTFAALAPQAAQAAFTALCENNDGQLCDVIVDRACLEDIWTRARDEHEVLQIFAENLLLCNTIKLAVRSRRTGKRREFMELALPEGGPLDKQALIGAALRGDEEIGLLLSRVGFSEGAQALERSLSAFEVWCDNALLAALRAQKTQIDSIGPLAAYVLARDIELKTVRIILTGKRSGLDGTMIRERVRDPYV